MAETENDSNLWAARRTAARAINNSRYEAETLSKNIATRAQIRATAWEARLASERQLDQQRERESRVERQGPEEKSRDPLQGELFESFTLAQGETVRFYREGYPTRRDRSGYERE